MKTYRHIAAVAAMLSAAPALADMTPAEQQATLAAHNTERASYPGVGALMWAPLLAQFAQQWAQSLADRNAWEHRSQSTLPGVHPTSNPFRPGEWVGENLFRGGWPPSDPNSMGPAAVALWIAEKQWYHRDLDDGLASAENKPPGCTAPAGNYCGHFTQVVWSRTQFVGCGKATATPEMGGRTYIVCNYYPAANYRNQFPIRLCAKWPARVSSPRGPPVQSKQFTAPIPVGEASRNQEDIMHRKNSKECCALWVRGFAALWAVLVLAEAFSIRTAVAQPFAFVTTVETNEFAMVDTATGRVVAMIPQDGPLPAAVTPDGKHAYVAENTNKVLVIDTATKNVVARIRVGEGPEGVAISLDGNHAFVLNRISRTISVIATATNKVTETVPTGDEIDFEDQIGADGKHIFSIK